MNERINLPKQKYFYPLLCFFGSIILCSTIFIWKGITPFGSNTLFMSDLGAQYLPFLSYYKSALTQLDGIKYSFSNGIGGNMLPLIAYYLTSPFNLLTLFFSTAQLPTAVSLLIILKIAAASSAMCFYLIRTYTPRSSMAILLSFSYAFCGFTGAYFYNIMWLDILIWLPLVLLALQALIEKNRLLPYILCLVGTIGSNFYLGYMVCLFLIFYFFYWIGRTRQGVPWRIYLKHYRKIFGRFVAGSITAAMMLGILLVPTAAGMLQTGKSDFDLSVFWPIPMYGLDGWAGLGMGTSNFTSRLHHLPTFYIGFLGVLLAFTFFFNKKIAKEKRAWSGKFLLLLILCTWFLPFLTVFQMFQQAAGFPFRNAFLVSFVLLTFAYESWLNREGIERKAVWRSGAILGIGFVLAYLFNHWTHSLTRYPEIKGDNLILNLLLILVACLTMALLLKESRVKRKWAGVAAILVSFELGLNFTLMLEGAEFGNLPHYQTYIKEFEKSLSEVDKVENPLVRISNDTLRAADFGVDSNGYNEGMLLNYNGVTAYTSTLASEVLELYADLGLYSWNERRISYSGSTPLTDLLLNVGYQLEGAEGEILVRENRYTHGIGFLVPEEAEEAAMLSGQPFQNQNTIFKSFFQTEQKVFHEVLRFEVQQEEEQYELKMEAATDGILYAWLPRLGEGQTYEAIRVNGEKIPHKFILNNDTLLPLGEFKKGETVRIELSAPQTALFAAENFGSFDRAVFEQAVQDRPAKSLDVISWKRGELLGEVESSKEQEWLFLSIPYDEGWQAHVQGKDVSVKKMFGGFMGIKVPAGKQEVRLEYVPAGYGIGKLLSAAGWLLFFVLVLWERKNNAVKSFPDEE